MSRIRVGANVLIACKAGSHLNDGKSGTVVANLGDCIGCQSQLWKVAAHSGVFEFSFFGAGRIHMRSGAFHDHDLIPIDPDEHTEGDGAGQPVDREVTA